MAHQLSDVSFKRVTNFPKGPPVYSKCKKFLVLIHDYLLKSKCIHVATRPSALFWLQNCIFTDKKRQSKNSLPILKENKEISKQLANFVAVEGFSQKHKLFGCVKVECISWEGKAKISFENMQDFLYE